MSRLTLANKSLKAAVRAVQIKAQLDAPARNKALCRDIHLKQYDALERSLQTSLKKFFLRQLKVVADNLADLSTPETEKDWKNCGTGSGGFKPGNTCARRGGGLSFGGNTVARGEGVDKVCQKTFGRDITDDEISGLAGAPSGSKIRVRVVDSGPVAQLSIKWTNKDIDADGLRYVFRGYSGPIISNQGITIRKGGEGYGTQILKHQVDTGVALGAAKIVTIAEAPDPAHGTVKNGYYTWPRLGYDAAIPYTSKTTLPDTLKGAERLSDLMKSPEGRKWWKDNGTDVEVTFDLSEGSQSRRVLDEYTKAKFGQEDRKSAGTDGRGRRNLRQDLGQHGVKNCGTGSGGFRPGNTCARGGRSTSLKQWYNGLSDEQKSSLFAWTGTNYKEVRDYEATGSDGEWRSPYAAKGTKWSDVSRHLNAALDTAPLYRGAMYRGLSEVSSKTIDKLTAVGSVMEINATSSYSSKRSAAESFSHASGDRHFVLLKVAAPKTAVQILSHSKGESEVIGRKGTKYKIVASTPVERDGKSGFEIELEEQ